MRFMVSSGFRLDWYMKLFEAKALWDCGSKTGFGVAQ